MKDLSPLSEIIFSLFEKKGWEKGKDLLVLKKSWKRCVGEFLARKTEPIRFKGDVLFVWAESPPILTELKLNEELLKKRIKEETGIEVSEIKFSLRREEGLP